LSIWLLLVGVGVLEVHIQVVAEVVEAVGLELEPD
jgi:hypothetical protein